MNIINKYLLPILLCTPIFGFSEAFLLNCPGAMNNPLLFSKCIHKECDHVLEDRFGENFQISHNKDYEYGYWIGFTESLSIMEKILSNPAYGFSK